MVTLTHHMFEDAQTSYGDGDGYGYGDGTGDGYGNGDGT